MTSRSLLLIAAAAVIVAAGCAKRKTTKGASPSTATAAPNVTMKMPRILTAMPEGAVLDLGPVLVPQAASGKLSAQAHLLEAADRLGADAFVAESSSITDVYRIQRVRVRTWSDGYGGDRFDTTVYVYSGSVAGTGGSAPPTRDVAYYRAIRFLKAEPPVCPIDAGVVGSEVARLLGGDLPFVEQLRILHVLFAQGYLDRRSYRKQRALCIAHLDASEAAAASTTE